MFKIQHKADDRQGEFYYEENDEVLAKLTYRMETDNLMKITHTNVDPILSGKGVGKLLAETAVLFARENRYKIVPLCPFVASLINKIPEWQDVI